MYAVLPYFYVEEKPFFLRILVVSKNQKKSTYSPYIHYIVCDGSEKSDFGQLFYNIYETYAI